MTKWHKRIVTSKTHGPFGYKQMQTYLYSTIYTLFCSALQSLLLHILFDHLNSNPSLISKSLPNSTLKSKYDPYQLGLPVIIQMVTSSTRTMYVQVIEDLISNIREEFINNGGPGEGVLTELQRVSDFRFKSNIFSCFELIVADFLQFSSGGLNFQL